jgi:hypothetical protein
MYVVLPGMKENILKGVHSNVKETFKYNNMQQKCHVTGTKKTKNTKPNKNYRVFANPAQKYSLKSNVVVG